MEFDVRHKMGFDANRLFNLLYSGGERGRRCGDGE